MLGGPLPSELPRPGQARLARIHRHLQVPNDMDRRVDTRACPPAISSQSVPVLPQQHRAGLLGGPLPGELPRPGQARLARIHRHLQVPNDMDRRVQPPRFVHQLDSSRSVPVLPQQHRAGLLGGPLPGELPRPGQGPPHADPWASSGAERYGPGPARFIAVSSGSPAATPRGSARRSAPR